MDVETIQTNIKRFFSNPNTLTFILVIVMIVVVYFVYSFIVNQSVKPVTIPYALQSIDAKTEITNDMIGSVKISGEFVNKSGKGLIQSRGNIVGKYVAEGYQIPQKSFFYTDQLVDEATAEKTTVSDAPDGYTVFALDVDFHSTYGCSIMPGNYIDLFFKAVGNDNKIMFDKFIESLKVTKVVDKDGNDVFATSSTGQPRPAKIYFIVPKEYNDLLSKAMLITGSAVQIIPVPRNAGYSENPAETRIYNTAIEAFIESKAVTIAN